MPERHQDWLRQARDDLEHARLSARQAHLEWAAFAAHQAAEKACKALHTRAELSRELDAGNRFVRRIVGESIVLYTRETR